VVPANYDDRNARVGYPLELLHREYNAVVAWTDPMKDIAGMQHDVGSDVFNDLVHCLLEGAPEIYLSLIEPCGWISSVVVREAYMRVRYVDELHSTPP
jgi:hypothetical protein